MRQRAVHDAAAHGRPRIDFRYAVRCVRADSGILRHYLGLRHGA
jgi:hypothetical protein